LKYEFLIIDLSSQSFVLMLHINVNFFCPHPDAFQCEDLTYCDCHDPVNAYGFTAYNRRSCLPLHWKPHAKRHWTDSFLAS